MSKDIRVSVVLASYNGAGYIGEQVQSWLEVLGEDDEIVISDDASTDGTVQVIQGITDPRVRVLAYDERVGYQKNFERAIHASFGRYIFFSDQDDKCLPLRVSASLAALQRSSVVFGDATLVDAQMAVVAPSFFSLRGVRSVSAAQLFVRPAGIGATMACNREFLMDLMPFPASVPHDHWISVVAALNHQLSIVREPFILYRRHSNAVSLTGIAGSNRSLYRKAYERCLLALAIGRHQLKLLRRATFVR